jgi:hypothetical protein
VRKTVKLALPLNTVLPILTRYAVTPNSPNIRTIEREVTIEKPMSNKLRRSTKVVLRGELWTISILADQSTSPTGPSRQFERVSPIPTSSSEASRMP